MLEKTQLERYLSLCMGSQADFAEIYEEEELSETLVMLDGKVEEVNRKIRNEHTAEGLYLRPRFSPGYGDLPLTLQKDIIRILNTPKTIGVSLTDACLMVPSKSVTALIGVSGNESRCVMAGCEECSSRNTCVYRR